MHDFLATVFIEVTISAVALFLFNAYPMYSAKRTPAFGDERDTVYWVKAAMYYFAILIALSFPLKYILKNYIC